MPCSMALTAALLPPGPPWPGCCPCCCWREAKAEKEVKLLEGAAEEEERTEELVVSFSLVR